MVDVSEKKIVIVGGGFGGVRTALDLVKQNIPNTKVILISDKPHFEYHALLYKVVTGSSPLEVCIPLTEIFKGKDVEVIEDEIVSVDLKEKKLEGSSQSHYTYDFLVLALGSQTAYFDLPGLKELSFGFKSITEALRLKRHIHEMFSSCQIATDREKECALRFVIVGGGATGTELAGELAGYTRKLAKKHGLDPKLVTIDLIQGADRLIPSLPQDVSRKVKKRLEDLGVTVSLNERVLKEEVEKVYLKDMQMRTKTVIWTAGVMPHHLYGDIDGLLFDEKGRVMVDAMLQVDGFENVFVIGDGAAGAYSGLAQTALHQGDFVASSIMQKIKGEKSKPYQPKKPSYAIPVGPHFAVFISNSIQLFGRSGWWMRRFADLRFFLSVLPIGSALTVFRDGQVLAEHCPICSKV